MDPLYLYLLNDNVLELTGLLEAVTGEFQNGASVSVTLVDSSDQNIAGATWPLTLSYVAASDGIYRATLVDTLSLTDGDLITAKVTADAGDGLRGYWETRLQVARRR